MLQESDQTPADAEPTEQLQHSAQQDTPADATETSSNSLNSATDNSPDVPEPDATDSKDTEAGKAEEGEAAKAEEAAGEASEPDNATSSPDADNTEGETSAEESSSSASTSRQLPEVTSASSAQSMQTEEGDMASSDEGQAAAASDTHRPESDVPTDTQVDDIQAAGLTFDEALAQSEVGAELSDPTPPSNSSSSSNQSTSDDLTFDQAVAATNGTQSITDVIANTTQSIASELKAIDPREMSPVLESLLPSTESLNGSLSAAIQEPEGASNATAASSGQDSHSNATDWTGLANATITKVGEELVKTANASVSMLDEVRTMLCSSPAQCVFTHTNYVGTMSWSSCAACGLW